MGAAENGAGLVLNSLERGTLALFASGRSYAEIAEARGKSAVTIRNTLYRIQDKLGIKSKQELVIWAVSWSGRLRWTRKTGQVAK